MTDSNELVADERAEVQFTFVERETCELCGSGQQRPLRSLPWRGYQFRWVLCGQCGLVYMNPLPDQPSYLTFYKDYFWDARSGRLLGNNDGRGDTSESERVNRSRKDMRDYRLPRISAFLGSALQDRSSTVTVLEVGCAWGETLNYLHDRYAVRALAVEPSDYAVDQLRRRYPFIEVVARSAEELADSKTHESEADIVVMSHVLENIFDQNEALRGIHRVLGDGGILYVDTSNLYWHPFAMNPYHPVIYTPETLTAMLAKHGFELEKSEHSATPARRFSGAAVQFVRRPSHYVTVTARKTGGRPGEANVALPDADEVEATWRRVQPLHRIATRARQLRRRISRS